MVAFNVVKFQVRPGAESRFLDAHRSGRANWPGLHRGTIIRTGEHTYCLIGEWSDLEALRAARADRDSRRISRRARRGRQRAWRHRRCVRTGST
jgi:hypothetical protein